MAQLENITTPRARKEKLSGIFLENEFPKSRRCAELLHLFGYAGYFAITRIWGEISEEPTSRLSGLSIQILIKDHIPTDQHTAFLNWLVSESLLDIDEEGFYTSETILQRKEARAKSRAKVAAWRASTSNISDEDEVTDEVTPMVTSELHDSNEVGTLVYSPKSKVISLDLKNSQPSTLPQKPKPPKPKFDPGGKTKYLDFVYLSDAQYQRVVTYYESKGLDFVDFQEAVRELDRWFSNNPKKRMERTDDAKALMGWPLDEALKRKMNLQRVENLKDRQNGTLRNKHN